MGIEIRKVYINFLSKKTVCITTPYKSKTFNLKEERNYYIDLVSLVELEEQDADFCNFFVEYIYLYDEDEYQGEVYVLVAEDQLNQIGSSHWKTANKETFNIKLWTS